LGRRLTTALPPDIVAAAARQREVRLTTTGRKTGKPRRVTIWITTDGTHVFVRSGGGLRRDWPQNFLARDGATLEIDGKTIKVKPRHVADPDEARGVSQLVRTKYGGSGRPSKPGEPSTPGEQATFEVLPAE
jgi:deazaflavin-dependent oxidoreductase (nitroreductase family)